MAASASKALGWYQRLPRDFVASAVAGARRRSDFDQVRAFVLFVGHARSGSTLVGSLLDAHPDAVLAHELDALRYLRCGLRRDQLYSLILESDRRFTTERSSRSQQGYSFEVADMWQGRFRRLEVVGDKHAGTSTRELRAHPELLDRLRRVTGVPIRLVHVVRNPWDNIATIAKRSDRDLEVATATYFRRCDTIRALKMRADGSDLALTHVGHEAFTADPATSLAELCRFLGLDPAEDYLAACAAIVRESPHRSRMGAAWPDGLVDDIARQAEGFDFLAGYSFDG